MQSLPTMEREAKFNTNDLIFRKKVYFTFWNTIIYQITNKQIETFQN